MPYIVVTAHDITDDEEYAKYSAASAAVIQDMPDIRVKKIGRGRDYDLYEGKRPGTQLAVFEFESEEHYKRFYYSDEYQKIINLRTSAAETQFIIGMTQE